MSFGDLSGFSELSGLMSPGSAFSRMMVEFVSVGNLMKDIVVSILADDRRWRLRPMNIIAGVFPVVECIAFRYSNRKVSVQLLSSEKVVGELFKSLS